MTCLVMASRVSNNDDLTIFIPVKGIKRFVDTHQSIAGIVRDLDGIETGAWSTDAVLDKTRKQLVFL